MKAQTAVPARNQLQIFLTEEDKTDEMMIMSGMRKTPRTPHGERIMAQCFTKVKKATVIPLKPSSGPII